jgi:hypothetical protein
VGKPGTDLPLEIPRLRWEDNFKMDLRTRIGQRKLSLSASGYGQGGVGFVTMVINFWVS